MAKLPYASVTAVWFAALPLAVSVGFWAVRDLQRFVLFAVLGTMVFPLALVHPGGTEVAIADLLLVAALGAWLISGSVRGAPGPWLSGNRLLAPALCFVGVNAASVAWSVHPKSTITFTIQVIEIVIVLPLVFASLPRSIDVIRTGLMVYVGITCLMAAMTAIEYIPRAAAGSLEGQYLPGLNKNAIGSYVAAGLVIAWTFWLRERRPRTKHVLGVAVAVELIGLFSSVSRGAIIGAFFALIAVSLLLRRQRARTLGIAVLAATLFLGTFGLHSGVSRNLKGSYDSSTVRSYAYPRAIKKIGKKPFLGIGGGAYTDAIPQLHIGLSDPNNMFLLTWAEIGIPGVAALLFLLYRYGRAFVASRRLPEHAAVPAVAAGAVTLSMLVHFQVDVTWIRGTTSLAFAMMGLMFATARLAPAEEPAERQTVASRTTSPSVRPSIEVA